MDLSTTGYLNTIKQMYLQLMQGFQYANEIVRGINSGAALVDYVCTASHGAHLLPYTLNDCTDRCFQKGMGAVFKGN